MLARSLPAHPGFPPRDGDHALGFGSVQVRTDDLTETAYQLVQISFPLWRRHADPRAGYAEDPPICSLCIFRAANGVQNLYAKYLHELF